MVTEQNRQGYIGGSDANRLFGNFDTATFKNWWLEKLTGVKLNDFENIHTAVGNIMEAEILRALEIPEDCWNKFVQKEGTIAGINTDALDDEFYHEVKTALPKYAFDWLHGMAISVAYRRQIQHGLWVTGRKVGKLHVFSITDREKQNPFAIENIRERIHTFEFRAEEFDMEDYSKRVMYLTDCYRNGKQPCNEELNIFLKQ